MIELMIVVAIIGILAAVAVPAFVKYLRKAKTVEATEGLDKIKVGAKAYFRADHYEAVSGNLLPKQFPNGSVVDTPGTDPCADNTVKFETGTAFTSAWNHAIWRALNFQFSEQHYYRWDFIDGGGVRKAATFAAVAAADLDCDKTFSTFKILGRVDSDYAVEVRGPIVTNGVE